jgi:hypothetical protein
VSLNGSSRNLGGTSEMQATDVETEEPSLAEQCFEQAHGDPLIALDIACALEMRRVRSESALSSLAVRTG